MYVPVEFDESPFDLTPVPDSGTCSGLELVAGSPETLDQAYQVPLTLRSSGPIAPQTCSGTFALRGPSGDYDVQPGTPLSWRLVVPAVEWEILGVERGGTRATDANLGSLGRTGEHSDASLRVRYTGKPPFSMQLTDLTAAGDRMGAGVGKDDLNLVASPPTQQAGTDDEYLVPIELLVRRSLSHASPLSQWLSGTDYSGKLSVDVAGLPASGSQEVSFRLHNPSLYQRYVQPFYRLLLPGIVTIPLSVFVPLFLFLIIWKRRKDASVERLMRRIKPQTLVAESGLSGMPTRTGVVPPSAGPPRWARSEPTAKTSAMPARSGYRVPQRQTRPAEAAKGVGTPPTASTSPAQSVPPPYRRGGTSQPRNSK